ncbi:hypothetical protein E8E14_005336 [Neopestalotiopsis sp. 37M]|nr:hypothetical protein E8E14_005336 [Neopestalotiopsis sp. 37M]
MGVESKPRRRSKRIRKQRQPTRKVPLVQRQSLRVAVSKSLKDVQPASDLAKFKIHSRNFATIRKSPSPTQESDSTFDEDTRKARDLSDLSNLIPSGQPDWYKIRRIVGQRLAYYLVEWEGIDPATGRNIPLEFSDMFTLRQIYQTDVSGPARREWHALQNAGKVRRARCGTLVLGDAQDSKVYEEAWQRSIKRSCGLL